MPLSNGHFHPGNHTKNRPLIPIDDIPKNSPWSPEEIDARRKLAACFRLVDDYGWTELVYNHITVKVPGTEDILINPFGLMYHEVTASSLIKISLDGKILDRGLSKYGMNRAGYIIHSAIHKARPDIFCTLHVHYPPVAGVSAAECGLLPINQEAMLMGPVAYLDYLIFDNEEDKVELTKVVTEDKKKKVLMLRNHGAITMGETVEETWMLMYFTVLACETQIKTMSCGNYIMPDKAAIKKAYDVLQRGANNMDNDEWEEYKFGEFEWETWMRDLDSRVFGPNKKAFVVQEVIDMSSDGAIKAGEYAHLGRHTNFNYGLEVSNAVRNIEQQNYASLSDLHEGFGYGNLADHEVLTFVDNHDNQRQQRQLGIVTYKEPAIYKMAVGFHLAWTYGYARVISGYYFENHDDGPPSNGAPSYETKSPEFNPDSSCKQEVGWVCEHRWPEIRHLAKFRSDVAGSAVTAIHKETHVLAFARLGKGYFAGNNDDVDRKIENVDTTLPPGNYCDVYLSAVYDGGKCGDSQIISVDSEGKATFTVKKKSIVAFTLKSATSPLKEPPKEDHKGWKRTVIFLKKETQPGENVFIRGGDTTKEGCDAAPSKDNKCTIPIEHVTAIDVESDVYPSTVYSAYQQWKQGDVYLDFKDGEARQGTHDGAPASGTPLIWTTNTVGNPAFSQLNADHNLGDSYWMVELLMDCSSHNTFDFKGVLNGVWENDIPSNGSDPPCSNGKSHVGRCGAVNIFKWNESACQIVDKK